MIQSGMIYGAEGMPQRAADVNSYTDDAFPMKFE